MWTEYRKYILGSRTTTHYLIYLRFFSEVVLCFDQLDYQHGRRSRHEISAFPVLNFCALVLANHWLRWMTIILIFSLIGLVLWFCTDRGSTSCDPLKSWFSQHIHGIAATNWQDQPLAQVTVILNQDPVLPIRLNHCWAIILIRPNSAVFSEAFSSQAGRLIIGLFSIVLSPSFFLKERNLFKQMIIAAVPAASVKSEKGHRRSQQSVNQIFWWNCSANGHAHLAHHRRPQSDRYPQCHSDCRFYAVANIIPYLGPIIGAAFGCLLTISSNLELDFINRSCLCWPRRSWYFWLSNYWMILFSSLISFQKRVQAHPLEIFLVIMIGARMNGILGMVLAIPTYTIFRVIAREFLSEFRIIRKMTEDLDYIHKD